MDFDSTAYLGFFLPAVALVHLALRHRGKDGAAQAWLLVASLAFYAFGSAIHIPLLLGSILFNWWIARRLGMEKDLARRRSWFCIGLGGNIALLAVFKYAAFFLGGLYALFGIYASVPHFAFPLGISFYTLTSVMYLVDCYEKLNAPLALFDYASAVSFFPYITSGPIIRSAVIAPQFRASLPPERGAGRFSTAVFRLASGLVKKIVLADAFAAVARAGFASTPDLSSADAWCASIAYTLQIYFDFSGYSDIAIGSAALLGIKIPENFNSPYISTSISEFWQRWHMSLSHFISNYLYTPIVRSFRKATLRTSAIATLLAMTIAGLWHGPAMTYVVFGVMHGAALVINQVGRKRKIKLPKFVGWLLTFVFVNCAFVVFRAPDLETANHVLRMMFVPFGVGGAGNLASVGVGHVVTSDLLVRLVVMALPLLAVWLWRWHRSATPAGKAPGAAVLSPAVCALLYSLMIYCVLFLGATTQGFIYTQF
jgi:D-alanyl-lipoteichoic acid acyltransferase DltB (MBOAT superfamily)